MKKLINNRILTDVDNQFYFNNFYELNLNLVNQFNDCNDDKEIIHLRNIINSHVKKYKESNTLPNLNNVDKKTKKLIYKLQKEFEEAEKEIDNIRNDELAIKPIQDKRITKKDENISLLEHEDFKELENYENISKSKYDFESEYNEITSSIRYKKIQIYENMKKIYQKFIKNSIMFCVGGFMVVSLGVYNSIILPILYMGYMVKKMWKLLKLDIKKDKLSR
ncbi:fam-b protein [Plasmodium vinckei vinckei]|uniref:Fam-b protein n=1 Tax=Plasmodium vinckei vinckei TaxID=54757 RepID=A0A449BW35_PLAVN|nr:fam-b protein [Plasmodium vinckei vinckei]VEV57592.1 fam-b protein [Plasmodium vinckei vinckei]